MHRMIFLAPALAAGVAAAQPAGNVTLRTPLAVPGGTAPRTLLDKLGEHLSLPDFGARCDGVADDSAAVAAAAARPALVEVPPGRSCLAPGVATLPANLVGGGTLVLAGGTVAATPSAASATAAAQAALAAIGNHARAAPSGSSFAVPAGSAWLSLVQPQALGALTLVLPPAPMDGQRLRISTVAAVGALTLSPAVAGWANGAAFPAGTGFEIDWDAASLSWLRVQ